MRCDSRLFFPMQTTHVTGTNLQNAGFPRIERDVVADNGVGTVARIGSTRDGHRRDEVNVDGVHVIRGIVDHPALGGPGHRKIADVVPHVPAIVGTLNEPGRNGARVNRGHTDAKAGGEHLFVFRGKWCATTEK